MKMDLARASRNYNVAVLVDGAGLLRIGLGGSGVGLGFKVMLLVRHDSLGQRLADIRLTDSGEGELENRSCRVQGEN